LLLAGACLSLGWKIYDDWRTKPPDEAMAPDPPAVEPGVPPGDADLALALPPSDRFAVIVERPLFSPARRPTPPSAVLPAVPEAAPELFSEPESPAVAEAPPLPEFTLVGIVIAGEERYALVERHADGQVVQVAEGGDIGGWFAVLIEPDRAVFRQGAVEEELVLKYETPVPADRIPPPRIVPPPQEPQAAEPAAAAEAPGPSPPEREVPAWKLQGQ
jgi:CBS domain-containing protein